MKKFFKITFFVTLAFILFFLALIVINTISIHNCHSDSVAIIGGADGPTAILVTRTLIFDNPLFLVFVLASILFIGSAIGWIITRKK